jgi:polar amino acid transport system substrate-binding protein
VNTRLHRAAIVNAALGAALLLLSLHTAAAGLSGIRIYTSADPPYVDVDAQDNVVGGTTVDRIFSILASLQLPRSMVHAVPWSRGYTLATTEPDTMIFPIAKTKARQQYLIYAIKLVDIPVYFYTLSSRGDLKLKTIDDARQYSVCAIHDDYRYDYLQEQGFKKIDTADDELTNLKKFLNGRCDLLLSTESGLDNKLQKLGATRQLVTQGIQPKGLDSALYAAFNKNTAPEVIAAFRQAARSARSAER